MYSDTFHEALLSYVGYLHGPLGKPYYFDWENKPNHGDYRDFTQPYNRIHHDGVHIVVSNMSPGGQSKLLSLWFKDVCLSVKYKVTAKKLMITSVGTVRGNSMPHEMMFLLWLVQQNRLFEEQNVQMPVLECVSMVDVMNRIPFNQSAAST